MHRVVAEGEVLAREEARDRSEVEDLCNRKQTVESRLRPNGGFGEAPGKLLSLKYNLRYPKGAR